MGFRPQIADKINGGKIGSDYKSDLGQSIPVLDLAFVGTLLGDVFGVNSPIYLPTWWNDRDFEAGNYSGISLEDELPDDGSPIRMGQKTFGAFNIDGGDYASYNQFTCAYEHRMYGGFLMPLATMVDFSRDKIMTKTPVLGSSGSVKEIFGFDDWNISISGIILPDPARIGSEKTIKEQMYKMQKYFEVADALNVSGSIFESRDIYRILWEKLEFKPIQGKPNMMQYNISAVSDEPLILTETSMP